ncbi:MULTISPECIES: LysM peptidoglycan-binding domain-containing protein [unclassified Streptomyces]|uniref:LysM peptidoglycan-binding domain-containing protein n=1 Tax=unclassified Streptomyces TaxID=2593676 RepID=UPI003D934363
MFALACTAVLSTVQSASAAPAAKTLGTTHTVQDGETLYRIARAENVPGGWQALASANEISSPYTLMPGQVLALPSDTSPSAPTKASPSTYTVQPGDTLYRIAHKYQVPGGWQALADANDVYRYDRLAIGQVLVLPDGSSSPAGDTTATKAAAPAKAATTTKAATPAKTATPAKAATPAKTYANNLDGWIKESLDVMAQHGIPGSYNGIYRNLMRESSGNPKAINLWDSNAAKGIPSKGLLQVIDPTFQAYHVPGTSWDIYDPVANITAACNYAYHRYGSIDNVNGPY